MYVKCIIIGLTLVEYYNDLLVISAVGSHILAISFRKRMDPIHTKRPKTNVTL